MLIFRTEDNKLNFFIFLFYFILFLFLGLGLGCSIISHITITNYYTLVTSHIMLLQDYVLQKNKKESRMIISYYILIVCNIYSL